MARRAAAFIVSGVATILSACGSPATDATVHAGVSAAQAGKPPAALQTVMGVSKENGYVHLEITEAGFWPERPAPAGLRYYTVGVRGTSRSGAGGDDLLGRSKGNDFLLDVRRFVYAQNDRGCIAHPERDVNGVDRLIGDSITFPMNGSAEGRLVFLVPDDTTRVRLLIAPGDDGGLIVPAGADFAPSWPAPLHTIDDGSTMRIHVLPIAPAPAALPSPAAGREHVVIDVAVENLSATQGIELQTSQQLRLVDAGGRFVQPSPALTQQLGCRLDDGDVIPPGHTRRLQAVYDVPAGAPRRLQYCGFEKDETIVDVKPPAEAVLRTRGGSHTTLEAAGERADASAAAIAESLDSTFVDPTAMF